MREECTIAASSFTPEPVDRGQDGRFDRALPCGIGELPISASVTKNASVARLARVDARTASIESPCSSVRAMSCRSPGRSIASTSMIVEVGLVVLDARSAPHAQRAAAAVAPRRRIDDPSSTRRDASRCVRARAPARRPAPIGSTWNRSSAIPSRVV
jgi:hypothetical protein